jgi:phosphohistidine phosphatase
VVSSPLVRCRQTGEIVAAALGLPLQQDGRLAPGMGIDGVEDLLIERPDAEAVLLCGHQPDLSLLVAALTAGGAVEFRKGSLAVLALEAPRRGGGRLRALYPPASLRELGAPR